MAFIVSCGSIEETPPQLIKSIEVWGDGEHISTISYRYDNQNRLIEVDNELIPAGNEHFKDTIIYVGDEIRAISEIENTTYTYKFSNGKPTECYRDMLEKSEHYYYEGDKIKIIRRDNDYTFKWKNGCITEVYGSGWKTTYEYTNIRNTLTIDILSLSSVNLFYPSISEFGSWCKSNFLPSNLTIVTDDIIVKTSYEYIFDDTTGKIIEIKISRDRETTKNGKFQKESSIRTLKITNY